MEAFNFFNLKKASEKLLNFCTEFTFYDNYFIGKKKETNLVHDFVINVMSEKDNIFEGNCILMLGVTDDMSLIIISKAVWKNGLETYILRVGILKINCLERLLKEEADEENKCNITIKGKKY